MNFSMNAGIFFESMSLALTPFFSSFFILLREGFEAMLIAVLVFMYLDKVKAREKRPAVFWGIAAKSVLIGGKLKGDISSDRVHISKTADVDGAIKQKTLSIEEGSVLKIKTEIKK